MTGLEELVKDAEVRPVGGAKQAPPKASAAAVSPVIGADDDVPLYRAHRKVYPQAVRGTFRRIKWALLIVGCAIYYLLPFLRWSRGPNAPDQAVLIDLPNHRFYFFSIEIWPQEVYYLTGLLIIAALVLFLLNAVAGRVWCGYLCPQTVWTDLYFAIERWVEGDRREHMQRDARAWTAETYARKALKHFLWLMIAWWTGGAWVLYFADAPTLVKELATGDAPFIAYAWIGILTFTTYTLAGHMREQVCTYMCPWPRIQASLTDEHALNVMYRFDRGEPRYSVRKAEQLRAQGQHAGDCVDCLQCVYACPNGVDIRQGPNVACIECGLCIDACDSVMQKLGRSAGLIGYDTQVNIKRRQEGKPPIFKLVRVRTVLYASIIVFVGGIMVYKLATRDGEGISIIHDRNPMFVRLSDGSLRNAYTVRIVNKQLKRRNFILGVDGIAASLIDFVGLPPRADGRQLVDIGPDTTREVRITVTDYSEIPPPSSTSILFNLIDIDSGEVAQMRDHFFGPASGSSNGKP